MKGHNNMDLHFSNAQRAEVLTQALPYIKQYNGKIVVVKYGGNAMINETLKQQVMEDIVLLWLIGVKVVLVHGGGPEISETMEKLGIVTLGAVGETFDPELHNAVMHEENEELGESVITDVFQKGYKMGDKVIRYAMVKVAN